MNVHWIKFGLLAVIFAFGCGDDDGSVTETGDTSTGGNDTLELSLSGLEPLGSASVYEGWVVVNDAPVSTGRFNLAANETKKTFTGLDLANAAMFVLTIEPAENDDPAPSDTKILAGPISDSSATLSAAAVLGTDFADAAGKFVIGTPTADGDDEDQGIWFLEMVDGTPMKGLTLPDAPKGFAYEGWVVVGGTPTSTGRFTSASGADSDGKGAAAGDGDAPPFPGQDFIDPALSLKDGMAVISLEPEPDDSPAPFAIKPLVGAIDTSILRPTSQDLMLNASLPSGSVVIR